MYKRQDMIWAMFKVYLNNPNYFVKQEDVLANLCMEGSMIVGVALALANGIRILIMYKNGGLALVIGLSLVATIVISKLIGCVLPLIAKKLHMDPAIMASPLITTLVDTCSILIYFNIATQVFQL